MATTLAQALSSFLPRLIPIPVAVDFRPDLGVFGFTALVALAAGIAFGLVPALHASRADLTSTLRTGGIGRGASASGLALRRVLVVGQLGLSFVLLAGATLLVRSVRNAYLADPGFRMRGVHVVSMDLARSGDFDATTRGALRGALVDRIAALPGVEAVGASTVLPIADHQPNRTPLPPGTRPTLNGPRPLPVYTNTVDGGYFAALGLRPVSGRVFEDRDHENSSQVVIVNEQFAERFFPDGGALDATLPFVWSPDGSPRIIGIVSDAAIRSLGETPPAAVYSPFTPASTTAFDLVIATRADMAATRRAVVDAIAAIDPRLPILRFAELDQLVGGSLAQTRLTAGVVGGAGALALVLAAVGLYGVIAYAVAQRTREFGIRLALGARQLSLLTMVLRQGASLAVMGITLGALTSLAALRAIERLLFGVTPFDAPTLFGIAAGLAIVTLLATGIPALRATRTDPARTLAD
jgi:putative ABC transport system permease protein